MSGVGGGDSISQEKFIESMQKLVHDPSLKGTLEGPLPLFFHAVDANNDGMISKEEFQRFFDVRHFYNIARDVTTMRSCMNVCIRMF